MEHLVAAAQLEIGDQTVTLGKSQRVGNILPMIKVAIGLRLGIDCGDPRPPALPLSKEQRAALERIVAKLDLR